MFSIFLIFFNFFFFVVFLIYLLILLSNFFQIKQNYKRKCLFNSFYFLKCLFNILVLLHIFVLCPAIDHLLMSPNLQHIYFTHALLLLLLLCRFEKLTPCTAFHCYLINFPQKHQPLATIHSSTYKRATWRWNQKFGSFNATRLQWRINACNIIKYVTFAVQRFSCVCVCHHNSHEQMQSKLASASRRGVRKVSGTHSNATLEHVDCIHKVWQQIPVCVSTCPFACHAPKHSDTPGLPLSWSRTNVFQAAHWGRGASAWASSSTSCCCDL